VISPRITDVQASAYTVPTESPETDGTFEWDSTTIIIAEVSTGEDGHGLGYTYASPAATVVIREHLARVMPLFAALGSVGRPVPVYGSGGFTSYTVTQLQEQLCGWVQQGIPRVKMKVGRDPSADVTRVRAARHAIGDASELFVDANAAYSVKQALAQADLFSESGVTWFEEPVSSDDLSGLRFLRGRSPSGIEIAAGEYGYDLPYFRRMLESGAVDVLQADATRCGGITEIVRVAALAAGYGVPVSTHTAPALHLHAACAIPELRHLEYFSDHVRIESLFFDGVTEPHDGCIIPDPTRPGLGIELKRADVEPFRIM
jgi:L-alanine-DL-glutamate epimerase-like enolase superfamily enzyme